MARVDTTLRQLTGYCMRRATTRAMTLVNESLAPFGLRRTTYSALSVAVDHPGIQQSQLADALAIERPNIVQIINELEQAGLIRRTPVPGDRRARGLEPTEAGTDLYRRAEAEQRALDTHLTQGLSPADVDALQRALAVVEANAGRQRPDGDPVPET